MTFWVGFGSREDLRNGGEGCRAGEGGAGMSSISSPGPGDPSGGGGGGGVGGGCDEINQKGDHARVQVNYLIKLEGKDGLLGHHDAELFSAEDGVSHSPVGRAIVLMLGSFVLPLEELAATVRVQLPGTAAVDSDRAKLVHGQHDAKDAERSRNTAVDGEEGRVQ
jgi:hypothetical protein